MYKFDIIQINNCDPFTTYGGYEGNSKTIVIATKDTLLKKQFKILRDEKKKIEYISFNSSDGKTDSQFSGKKSVLGIDNSLSGMCKILLG
ncbi:hypothetical protein [Sediminibacillus halophilus]|uniref:Uncharacterized protein n=1 Tax=Sediminibacillus halophilus TaxID=482461 RepID=A0A1G9QV63_9BACI|nr:hypothetical protein [Sediminibacillus halophilus]SDM14507.1 hypothetical protein SAMN05216244_1665 [Sediminibacillus halophilus]